MDNWEDPTPNKSNPSSLEPNSLPISVPVPVPVTTSNINSNTKSEGDPPSRSNKRKTSKFRITLKN